MADSNSVLVATQAPLVSDLCEYDMFLISKSKQKSLLTPQVLNIRVCDSHITGRPDVGYVKFPLTRMPQDGCLTAWLPVQVCLMPCTPLLVRHFYVLTAFILAELFVN